MRKLIDSVIRPFLHTCGIEISKFHKSDPTSWTYPVDFSDQNKRICNLTKPYTMQSPERLNAIIEAVRYIVANKIEGAFVECGVYKGGSAIAIASILKELGDESRDIYLYDTYSGMSAPTEADVSIRGDNASKIYSETAISETASRWSLVPVDKVKENVYRTNYPKHKLHFIQGKVEDTIPANVPDQIALLRLDTDFYESTKHELVHLYPRIEEKGVLIIDDYGHWKGARKAVDEYIAENRICILLNRIDYTGRMAVKVCSGGGPHTSTAEQKIR